MADNSVLLVEGKDDEHVFYHLLEHHQVPGRFKIKNKEGVDILLGTLDVELLASDLERLGIVVDADTDLDSRWQSLRNILGRAGYAVPESPSPDGTIIQRPDHPCVGIWIMPDNTLPGMLEDFVSFLVSPDDPLWEQADDCVQQIPEQYRHFPRQHEVKAHLHTWLAWQEEPGTPMGLAITKHYLKADTSQATLLMDWVRRLFNIND